MDSVILQVKTTIVFLKLDGENDVNATKALHVWLVLVLKSLTSQCLSVVTTGPQGEKGRDGLPGQDGK